jgi:DNA-directed RNA polymerase III subunit RPC3
VKNALLVLIQHNCVQAFSTPRGASDKTVTLYLAILDNALHQLRFSKFLSVIYADIPESEALIEGLLLNGRLTFDQLVERTISKIPEGSTVPTREEIRMNFNKLVYAHYVERCPKPEPFFDPLVDEQPTSSRKRAPKTVEEVRSLEQKVVCTAALSDAERFSEIPYSMESSLNQNDCHHQSVAGVKRKHESLEVDEENTIIAENEVLWRANFEKLIFCLKKKFCAEQKKAKLKLGTHSIWEAFLEASVTDKDNKSVTSPINGILERLQQKEGGSSMTLDQVTRVLNDLECSSTSTNSEAFTFDLKKLVETCRNDEIESLVKKKYGQEAYIIFRLLVKRGCPIETDEITDATILDKQNVHKTLYRLWEDEYIDLERVSAGVNTHYFVWRVKSELREKCLDNLYHAALNLCQLINDMTELLLERSKDEIKLRNRKNILILALTRHDDSLMLFHDF